MEDSSTKVNLMEESEKKKKKTNKNLLHTLERLEEKKVREPMIGPDEGTR